MPFNRKTLEENGTKKIEFKDKKIGKLFEVELDHQKDRLVLEANINTAKKNNDEEKEKFSLWNYPENTVVAFINTLGNDYESIEKLKTFALSRGLTPMYEVLEGFPTPKKYQRELYYTDNGNLFKKERETNKPFIIGHITKDEEYFGPNGTYNKPKQVSVFARALNEND